MADIYRLGQLMAKRTNGSLLNVSLGSMFSPNQLTSCAEWNKLQLLSNIFEGNGMEEDLTPKPIGEPQSNITYEVEQGVFERGVVQGPHTKEMSSIEPSLKQRVIESEMTTNANLLCVKDIDAFLEDFFPTEGFLAILMCKLDSESDVYSRIKNLWEIYNPPVAPKHDGTKRARNLNF